MSSYYLPQLSGREAQRKPLRMLSDGANSLVKFGGRSTGNWTVIKKPITQALKALGVNGGSLGMVSDRFSTALQQANRSKLNILMGKGVHMLFKTDPSC